MRIYKRAWAFLVRRVAASPNWTQVAFFGMIDRVVEKASSDQNRCHYPA